MPDTPLPSVIRLHASDNIAVARTELPVAATLGFGGIVAVQAIPRGHKVAPQPIAVGRAIRQYGQVIGTATRAIAPGEHMHLRNMEMGTGDVVHEFCADARQTPLPPDGERRTFEDYLRRDGQPPASRSPPMSRCSSLWRRTWM